MNNIDKTRIVLQDVARERTCIMRALIMYAECGITIDRRHMRDVGLRPKSDICFVISVFEDR